MRTFPGFSTYFNDCCKKFRAFSTRTWTPIFRNIFLELISGLRLGSGLLKGSQVCKFKKRSKVKGLNVERLKTVQGLSYFLG